MTVQEFEIDGGTSGGPSMLPARAERPWHWLVAAAALVAAGTVAAPAHNPTDGLNLIASLAAPPALMWEAAVTGPPRPSARLEAEVVGDVVAVTTDAAVTGYELATGAIRWQVAVERGRCTYQEEVVCATGQDSSAQVVTIDPRTGGVETASVPDAAWALRVDGDLLALVYSGRTQSVIRIGADGVAWSTPVPYHPGIGAAARGYPFARIGERLFVGTSGPAVLDVETGATLERPLLLRYDDAGIFGLGFHETWWRLWSGELITLQESAARLAVDDALRSRTGVVVAPATGVAQLREGPAEPWWSGASGEVALARLAGVLVTTDVGEAHTQGVDLATGDLLWTDELMSCPCRGSGEVLLATGSVTVPAGLTAIDVRSGLPLWQLAFPAATHMVTLVEGGVLVAGTDRVLLYRW